MGSNDRPLSPRIYTGAFAGVIAAFAAGLCLFAATLGPPVGDLTRVAGLSEYRYGWNGASEGFGENHFEMTSLAELEAGGDPGEILVLGDSYSFQQGNNITYTNTLHALTGRTVKVAELRTFKEVKDYFLSPAFAKNPPEAVLIETAERLVYRRSETSLDDPAQCASVAAPRPLQARPVDVRRVADSRRQNFVDFDELVSWGALAARLKIFLPRKVAMAELSTPSHFSSAAPSTLLFYFEDIANHLPSAFGVNLSEALPGRVACVLTNLVAAGAPHSSVYLTVAPDKRTMYEPFIVSPLPRKEYDMLAIARAALGQAYIDVYAPLKTAISQQTLDVYWPNDTHWGSAGHAIAGRAIARAMSGGG